jgi:hypothetical protein
MSFEPWAESPDVGRPSTTQKLSQLAELVEAIEDRVLAQLERRGGRYQGMF